MRVLIGYDGSNLSDAAIDDLQRSGLPDDVEALIVSVAEVWMPPPKNGNGLEEYSPEISPEWILRHKKLENSALSEAEALSHFAMEKLQMKFPGWKISSEALCGSPAKKILKKSAEFQPDLILIGSEGKMAFSRLFLGSISNKVLTEAKCSVRIARRRIEIDPMPLRLIIGFNGSPESEAAVNEVASRKWRDYSEVRLITAIDTIVPDSIGRFIPPVATWVKKELQIESGWIKKIAENSLRQLKNADLTTELCVRDGNPKQILVEEAAQWNADCIFIGATSYASKLEQFLIGSTAAAVAERARCSVEVVRR